MTHSRTTQTYAGNIDLQAAAQWIAAQRSIVLTTHLKPDGDAIGTSLALARAIRQACPNTTVDLWYAGVLPDFLPELLDGESFTHIDTGPLPSTEDVDAFVIVDTGAWSQLAPVRAALEGHAAQTLIIDHHLSGDAEIADRRIIDPSAAAAAQIVAELCAILLDVKTSELPEPIASPLYMGLATDTGWFRFSNVTPATMRLAADLIQAGVDHTEFYRIIEQRDHPGRLRLLGRALRTLAFYPLKGVPDRVAIMGLTRDDFARAGARPGDTGGFADRPLSIASVAVSIVLNEVTDEEGNPMTKISMRSKPGPEAVDVNQIAMQVGGGGHARAAGARIFGSLATAKARLLEALGVPAEAINACNRPTCDPCQTDSHS